MAGPWDDYSQSGSSGTEPWRQYSSEPEKPTDQGDGAFKRGWNKAKQNLAITSDLALGDTEGAARGGLNAETKRTTKRFIQGQNVSDSSAGGIQNYNILWLGEANRE